MAFPSYASSVVTAVNRAQQNLTLPQFVVGGRNNSLFALQKITTTYSFSVWRSAMFRIGTPFDVLKISFQIFPVLATNMSIIPVLYFDNLSSSSVGATINTTNYAAGTTDVTLVTQNFGGSVRGNSNFFFELQFTGSVLVTVGLPISIDLEVYPHL